MRVALEALTTFPDVLQVAAILRSLVGIDFTTDKANDGSAAVRSPRANAFRAFSPPSRSHRIGRALRRSRNSAIDRSDFVTIPSRDRCSILMASKSPAMETIAVEIARDDARHYPTVRN